MTIALRPLRNPNPLGFPGGILPGFDASHPASQGISSGHGFSGIANTGFISLPSGKAGTKNGTPTAATRLIGPTQLINSGTLSYTFTGQSTANDTSFTIGTIVEYTAVGSNSFSFTSSGSASTGIEFGLVTTTVLGFTFPGGGNQVTWTLPITLANSVPYFMAMSASKSGSNFLWTGVLVNLATGQTFSSSGTTASTGPVAPNGTYMVGNSPAGFTSNHGYEAAVMFSPAALSVQQLLQWAQDPWAFWIPRTLDLTRMIVGTSAATFIPAWAMNTNLPVLGTGTY